MGLSQNPAGDSIPNVVADFSSASARFLAYLAAQGLGQISIGDIIGGASQNRVLFMSDDALDPVLEQNDNFTYLDGILSLGSQIRNSKIEFSGSDGATGAIDFDSLSGGNGLSLWHDDGVTFADSNGFPVFGSFDSGGIELPNANQNIHLGAGNDNGFGDYLGTGFPVINFNAAGSFSVRDNGGNIAGRFDASAVAANTRLLVWDVDTGALQRVSVGAANTGGVGFKLLRIPN